MDCAIQGPAFVFIKVEFTHSWSVGSHSRGRGGSRANPVASWSLHSLGEVGLHTGKHIICPIDKESRERGWS